MSLTDILYEHYEEHEISDFCAWCLLQDYHIGQSLGYLVANVSIDYEMFGSVNTMKGYINMLDGNLPTVAEVINNEYK